MLRYWEQDYEGNDFANENDDFPELTDSDSDSDEISPREAGIQLCELLINLYMTGILSAKTFSIICHWCKLAGVSGPVGDLGSPPGRESGNYQKTLDAKLGFKKHDARGYKFVAPGHHKYDISRTMHENFVVPPHESLRDEVADNPEVLTKLGDSITNQEWAPDYFSHPVVRGATKPALPFALYVDGAPYSKNDGFLAFIIYNLVTNVRHLSVLILKSDLCQCGCRGWCTIYPVMVFLHWSMLALAQGENPPARHDHTPFGEGDDARLAFAGMELAFVGALLLIKGDWMEFCYTFGFPNWKSIFPCLFCKVTINELYNLSRVTPLGVGYEDHTDDAFDESCRACEIWIEIDEAKHVLLKANLRPDARKHANGRCIQKNLPELGLRTKDRLEPCSTVPDTGKGFDDIDTFPIVVLFWRSSQETRARHRNPLFDANIGIGVSRFAIDTLHCLDLGVFKNFCMELFWALLIANAWHIEAPDQETRDRLSVLRLRSQLFDWYKRSVSDNKSKLQNLTLKMLGKRTQRRLKTKAAETRVLLKFCVFLCNEHAKVLGSDAKLWKEAAEDLVRFVGIMEEHERNLPQDAIQDYHYL